MQYVLDFLILRARLVFKKLRQLFVKAPIFYQFNLEYHIYIKIDVLEYAISRILSQLASNDLGLQLMTFFSRKMILTETRYETHNSKLLAIIEAFQTQRNYLKDSQYKVFILNNYNNLQQFMDIKNLSSKLVYYT